MFAWFGGKPATQRPIDLPLQTITLAGGTQVNAADCIDKPVPALSHSGTFPGVTTCVRAFVIVGAGLFLPAGMSEFTITTITAFFSGR